MLDRNNIVELIKDLAASNLDVRCAAAEALGECGPKAYEALPALIKNLRSQNGWLLKSIASAISKIGPAASDAIPDLINILKQTQIHYVREHVIEALCKIGPIAIPSLITILEDPLSMDRGKLTWSALKSNVINLLINYDSFPYEMIISVLFKHNLSMHYNEVISALEKVVKKTGVHALPILVNKLSEGLLNPQSFTGMLKGMNGLEISELIKGLAHENKNVRLGILYVLANIGSAAVDAVPALINIFASQDNECKSAAMGALGNIGVMAIPDLKEALSEQNNEDIKNYIILTFSKIGTPATEVIPDLIKILQDTAQPLSSKRSVIETLSIIGNDTAVGAIPYLLEVLDGNLNSREKATAVRALGKIGTNKEVVIPRLVSCLVSNQVIIPIAAAAALVNLTPTAEQAMPFILQAWRDGRFETSYSCPTIKLITEMGATSLPYLINGLKDDNDKVKINSLSALASIGPEADIAAPYLIKALESKNQDVRKMAVIILGKVGPSANIAIPYFIKALEDSEQQVQYNAVESLKKMGSVAVPYLIEALNHNRDQVKENVAKALGEMGSIAADAVPALIKVSSNKNTTLRINAIEALGEIGALTDRSLPCIVNSLSDKKVTSHAITSLGKIGVKAAKFIPDLMKFIEGNFKGTVENALVKIGPLSIVYLVDVFEGNRSKDAKIVAINVFSRLGSLAVGAIPYLGKALKDKDESIREKAALALGKITHPSAIVYLKEALKDEFGGIYPFHSYPVRQAADQALKEISTSVSQQAAEIISVISPAKQAPRLFETKVSNVLATPELKSPAKEEAQNPSSSILASSSLPQLMSSAGSDAQSQPKSPITQCISWSDLAVRNLIGNSPYREIYKGYWYGSEVTIKKLSLQNTSSETVVSFEEEAKKIMQWQFPNIVRLYGICKEVGNYAMVLEYMSKGSLRQLLGDSKEILPWSTIRWNLAIGIGSGLAYLHSQSILHCNLTSSSILIDGQYNAKISDIGLSKTKVESSLIEKAQPTIEAMESIRWLAPELFKRGAIHSKASDVYSYGMLLCEIATRKIPYSDSTNEVVVMGWIKDGEKEKIPDDCPNDYKSIINACWGTPEQRATAAWVTGELLKAKDGSAISL